MENNRNFILAVVLSLAVLLAWQVLYVKPMAERARLQQHTEAAQNAPNPSAGETSTPGAPIAQPAAAEQSAPAPAFATREAAIAASPRVEIDSPALLGSINLKGARIDDVVLRDYTETVNPKSPKVVLLSPSGSPHPYFTYTGWWSKEPGVKLPGEDTLWQQEGTGPLTATHPVVLRYDNGEGLIFRRTISIDDHYMFTISDEVENKSGQAVTLRPWGQVAELTEPKTMGYSVLQEGPIGVFGNSGLKELTYSSALKNFDPATNTAKDTYPSEKGGWLGFTSQYWAAVLIPNQSKPFEGMMFGNGHKQFYTNYLQQPVTVAPGGSETVTNRLFAGAKEVKLLEKYRSDLGIERFNKLVDWGWFFFITEPMFYLMDFLYQLVGNFGLAIMLTTVIVKLAFFPLANKSFESMSKMKKLQPEMKKIQERFKEDKARQQEALMKLYKDEKVNPMAGCLPMFIQIPVFFSLYKVLLVAIEMRHAPFFGWIKDLSAHDPTTIFNLFGLIPWTPPAWLPMLGVLPLLMGISMWVQMRLNPTPADPVQQQIFTWMPVVFTFMMVSFPAGLMLYWTWNNILSFTQQALIMKRQGVDIDIMHNVGIKKVHGRVQQARSRLKNNGRSRTPAE
ncbi:MAG: membrane protein insertase YidC [Rhodomicrobium sp.]